MPNEYKNKLTNTIAGIKKRCNNPNHMYYKYYGGRGIKCDWKGLKDFTEDMEKSMLEHLLKEGFRNTQIDRIDNDGNYNKENCHWVTCKEQARNRSDNRKINGKCISHIGVALGGNRNLVGERIKHGWSEERAVSTPAKKAKKYKYKGKEYTLKELSKKFNIKRTTLERRIYKAKLSVKDAVETTVLNKYKYKGQEHSLYKWSKLLGFKYQTVYWRMNNGRSFEEALISN